MLKITRSVPTNYQQNGVEFLQVLYAPPLPQLLVSLPPILIKWDDTAAPGCLTKMTNTIIIWGAACLRRRGRV